MERGIVCEFEVRNRSKHCLAFLKTLRNDWDKLAKYSFQRKTNRFTAFSQHCKFSVLSPDLFQILAVSFRVIHAHVQILCRLEPAKKLWSNNMLEVEFALKSPEMALAFWNKGKHLVHSGNDFERV